MNTCSKCASCGWQGPLELTVWMIENEEEQTDYSSRCPRCMSIELDEINIPDEDEVTSKFANILDMLKEIDTMDARDLELNVKLLQDKVRDRYFRMDVRRMDERRNKRRIRKKKQTSPKE